MTKILLPIDVTRPTEPLLAQMKALLPLADKHVHALYVNEAWPAYENVLSGAGDFADDWKHKLEDKAKIVLAEVQSNLSDQCASFTSEIVTGPPAMMIESVARDEHADITIVRPGHHPAIERFLLGSVSAAVVKHGHGTIIVCHGDKAPPPAMHVVVALDGSPNSKEALRRSIDLFGLKKPGVKVSLIHAVDVADPIKFVSPVEFIASIEQNLIMEGDTLLAEGKKILAEAGITNVDMVLKEGKAASRILELAEAIPANLIVVGAEGRTAVQHFLMGSVSQRVAMHAPCPVAVFKRQYKPS